MRPSWFRFIFALAVLWTAVGGAMQWLQSRRPTPEKIEAFLATQKLEGASEAERKTAIESLAAKVNGLDSTQRRVAVTSGFNGKFQPFWTSLTNAEKTHYFQLIVPRGMKQMIDQFSAMDPVRRKRELERAIRTLRENTDDDSFQDVDPALAAKLISNGLKTFYTDASIDAKMAAVPLLEELERSIKWRR